MITEFIGFFIIVGVLIAVIIRRQIKKTDREPAELTNASQDLQREIERVGSQMVEQVELSMDRLEALMDEADRKISLLDAKMAQLNTQQDANEPADLPATESFAEILLGAEDSWRDQTEGKESVTAEASESPVKRIKTLSTRNQIVFELMEQGLSEEEISRRTGIGKNGLGLLREIYKMNKNGYNR